MHWGVGDSHHVQASAKSFFEGIAFQIHNPSVKKGLHSYSQSTFQLGIANPVRNPFCNPSFYVHCWNGWRSKEPCPTHKTPISSRLAERWDFVTRHILLECFCFKPWNSQWRHGVMPPRVNIIWKTNKREADEVHSENSGSNKDFTTFGIFFRFCRARFVVVMQAASRPCQCAALGCAAFEE